MAIITTKTAATTSESEPSETQLHMLAATFIGKLFICYYLWNFQGRIIQLQAIVAEVHHLETCMAIRWDSFSREIELVFRYLRSARTADFETYASNIDYMPVVNTKSSQDLFFDLHNFPLETHDHHALALPTDQFHAHFQTSLFSRVQYIHKLLLTEAFNIDESLFKDCILTVVKDHGLDIDLIVIVKVLYLLSLFEFIYNHVLVSILIFPSRLSLLHFSLHRFLPHHFHSLHLFLLPLLPLHLLQTVILILQFKLAFIVYLLKVILNILQSIEQTAFLVVFTDNASYFLFIVVRNALVSYFYNGFSLGISFSIDEEVQSVLFEVKVGYHLFLIEQWPHFNDIVELFLAEFESISKFSDYLIVFFQVFILNT